MIAKRYEFNFEKEHIGVKQVSQEMLTKDCMIEKLKSGQVHAHISILLR